MLRKEIFIKVLTQINEYNIKTACIFNEFESLGLNIKDFINENILDYYIDIINDLILYTYNVFENELLEESLMEFLISTKKESAEDFVDFFYGELK